MGNNLGGAIMDWGFIGSLALCVMSFGLFQELQRNIIIKKRENGEDASWGLTHSLLAYLISIFVPTAIVTILYSIFCLYRMGCSVKLCLWMPRELSASPEDLNKLKRLKNRAEKIQEAREKIAQDLKDKKQELEDKKAAENKKPDEPEK